MSQPPDHCPFCGSKDIEAKRNRWAQCNGCGAYGPNAREGETAVEAWNRRANKENTDGDEEAL